MSCIQSCHPFGRIVEKVLTCIANCCWLIEIKLSSTISNEEVTSFCFPSSRDLGGLPGLEAFDLAQRMKDQGHAVSLICGTTGWPSADLWRHKKRLKR